ncbi:hypothetical protein [Aminobacter sp. DSM 101952]|uniref:hypothetical protein n=1 Tax=Aminobacter sp. DSM 101952 TaxID=2735891 RepID=UPI0012E3DD6F|nr:hypothetical protein [Aminobacter sp. DSM 101952]
MKRRIDSALIVAAMLFSTGCVQQIPIQTQFNNAEHEFANKPGKATISGQAFMRRNDGVVVYAAGSPVYLTPQTPYTMEAFNRSASATGPVVFTNPDARLKDYTRVTQTNGEGRFTFSGVPDGPFIVATTVHWMAGDMRQGGDLTKLFVVTNGQGHDIIMTR